MPFGTLTRSSKPRQPPKAAGDGCMLIEVRGNKLQITELSATGEHVSTVTFSEHNVWALIALLCLFVGLKLPASVEKGIRVFG
jgi:hypothetical protein